MIKETSVNINSARETQALHSVNNVPSVGELQRLLPFEKVRTLIRI